MPRPHISMRKIRDVHRLRFGEGLSLRQVSASTGIPFTTVSEYIRRAKAAGLGWPLPDELDDGDLEALLFKSESPQGRLRPLPDWKKTNIELRRKHVTLMLLWHEYKETFPDGYEYSQYAELYRRWCCHLDTVMRQSHKAGEKRRVASHVRSYRSGYTTDPAHMPESHRRHASWTPSRVISWARQTGPSTAKLAEAIMAARPHPEQGFRSCMGIIRLGNRYGADRLEAACARALSVRSYRYRSVESILRAGLDKKPLTGDDPERTHPTHDNLRGPEYYR
jgi:transposase